MLRFTYSFLLLCLMIFSRPNLLWTEKKDARFLSAAEINDLRQWEGPNEA